MLPGGDAVEDGPGVVLGSKARQLLAAGGSEGAADLVRQLRELCSCRGSAAPSRWEARFREVSVQEVPGCKRGYGRSGKRVQVGGGGGEGTGRSRRKGNESGSAR
jgi:hypothetical protein